MSCVGEWEEHVQHGFTLLLHLPHEKCQGNIPAPLMRGHVEGGWVGGREFVLHFPSHYDNISLSSRKIGMPVGILNFL